ncbi:MAG: hypothetical protein LCH78_18125 [Proteobacteria bacterium]|nr:hypothetical protein [Pseudomonadota bacterium]
MPTKAEALAELARRGLYKPSTPVAPPTKLTEDQGKSQDYARQMATAEQQYLEARRAGYDPTSFRNSVAAKFDDTAPGIANLIRDDASDRGMAAQRAWLDARLKAMTGAGQSAQEARDNPRTYFPQFGEGGTMEPKYNVRREAYNSTRTRAGPGGDTLPKAYPNPAQWNTPRQNPLMGPQQAKPQARQASGPRPGMVEDGYRFKGGDPANPQSWERVR